MDENSSQEEFEAIIAATPAAPLCARILLNMGVEAFVVGNLTVAEAAFQEVIHTAEDSVTRNTGRIYLANMYCVTYLPNKLKDPPEAREAEGLFREVLRDAPTDEQHERAEGGLAAIQTIRSLVW
jgi:hypothetical protein